VHIKVYMNVQMEVYKTIHTDISNECAPILSIYKSISYMGKNKNV